MADSDPEDEVRDIEPPEDRPPDAGDAESLGCLVEPRPDAAEDDRAEECHRQVKPPGRVQQRAQQVVADLAGSRLDHGRPPAIACESRMSISEFVTERSLYIGHLQVLQ